MVETLGKNHCLVIFIHKLLLLLASRAKLSAVSAYSKIRGTAKSSLYPQPEGLLGDCMVKYGGELGAESVFGNVTLLTPNEKCCIYIFNTVTNLINLHLSNTITITRSFRHVVLLWITNDYFSLKPYGIP